MWAQGGGRPPAPMQFSIAFSRGGSPVREPVAMRTVRSVITLCFAVCYIINVFLRAPLLDDVNIALMVVVLVMSVLVSAGSSRLIGVILIVISIGLLLYAQAPIEEWARALRKNADLIVMFILIPLIGIPVQHGGYSESLRGLFTRHANSEGRYYSLVSTMTAVIGALISIAAVPLTFEMSRESRLGANKRLLGTALARGFVTCMIWAPTSATIALVVSVTSAEWVSFAPCAVICALAAEGVGIMMTVLSRKGREDAPVTCDGAGTPEGAPGMIDKAKVAELVIFSMLLIGFIAAISQLFGFSAIIVVAMASLVWPFIWMLVIRRFSLYREEVRGTYFEKKLPNAKNQIVLFAGAGMLAQSIGYSGIGDVIAQALVLTTGQSVLLLTTAVVAIVLLTCAMGIHPIVATAVIGGAIDPALCGITAPYLALVLSISWALGNTICPTSANVIAVADMVQASPVEASLRWNGPYAVITAAVLIACVMLVRGVGFL